MGHLDLFCLSEIQGTILVFDIILGGKVSTSSHLCFAAQLKIINYGKRKKMLEEIQTN